MIWISVRYGINWKPFFRIMSYYDCHFSLTIYYFDFRVAQWILQKTAQDQEGVGTHHKFNHISLAMPEWQTKFSIFKKLFSRHYGNTTLPGRSTNQWTRQSWIYRWVFENLKVQWHTSQLTQTVIHLTCHDNFTCVQAANLRRFHVES